MELVTNSSQNNGFTYATPALVLPQSAKARKENYRGKTYPPLPCSESSLEAEKMHTDRHCANSLHSLSSLGSYKVPEGVLKLSLRQKPQEGREHVLGKHIAQ